MKVVILAGGRGTRISEESVVRPKPMIEIGDYPILWHIMKGYAAFGYNDFIVCCGYKGYVIKEYFANYYLHHADVTFDFKNHNEMHIHNHVTEPWRVTLVDTGINTETGARIRQVKDYIGDETFMLTYGDGVSDVDISELVKFHESHGAIGTMTAVQPGGRFGVLGIENKIDIVTFEEKSNDGGRWINAGFMVMNPQIFQYIREDSNETFERQPLERLAKDGQLKAYKHDGFWQCMDTMRDKILLNDLWNSGNAPWAVWESM